MTYLYLFLAIAAFVGGIAFFKHRAKLKAAAEAEAKKLIEPAEKKL